jgi:hypothetical protein
VVTSQLLGLAAVRAYTPKSRASVLFQVFAGVLIGTLASSGLSGRDAGLRGRLAERV